MILEIISKMQNNNKDFVKLNSLVQKLFNLKVMIDNSYCFSCFTAFTINKHEKTQIDNSLFDIEEKVKFDQHILIAKEDMHKEIEKQKEVELVKMKEEFNTKYEAFILESMKDILNENSELKTRHEENLSEIEQLKSLKNE